jgi:hypothetical protein
LLKRLLRNKNGTAEVIGTVLFIIILLFFFTNVYLWHDAATRQMNDLYVQKINSPITVSVMSDNHYQLNVTNRGGVDAKLSILWVDVGSTGSPDRFHGSFNIVQQNIVVSAGSSKIVTWTSDEIVNSNSERYNPQTGDNVKLTMITTVGNSAACSYQS